MPNTVLQIPPPYKEPRTLTRRYKTGITCNRILIALVFIIAAGLGIMQTLSATDERDRANANSATVLSLTDQIQLACASGTIPLQYASICEQADAAEQQIVGPQGERGPRGMTGENGANGKDGDRGPVGRAGEPPIGWSTERADGSVETCVRVTPFDEKAPRYNCTVTEEQGDGE